jgi:hypothetical protein
VAEFVLLADVGDMDEVCDIDDVGVTGDIVDLGAGAGLTGFVCAVWAVWVVLHVPMSWTEQLTWSAP